MMDRAQGPNLARMPGLYPYSFSKYFSGLFLMTTESQNLGLTSHPELFLFAETNLKGESVQSSF